MATEKRLIDADAFKGKLIRELNKTGKYTPYECGLDDAISYLDDAPTVDAVEVVHGEWEKQQGIYSCSICGKACPYDVQADIIQYWPCNYCPNCGAKMDGKENQ
jgi:hypothetical protein